MGELGKLSALEYTPECYAYSQSHHLCRPVSERPLYYLSLTLHLSLFLSMLQKLVRILLSDWILLHCFHRKEFRRKASLLPRFLEIMSVMWPLLSGCVLSGVLKHETLFCVPSVNTYML